MMSSVWAPNTKTLQHPQQPRSHLYLARGSDSRAAIRDRFLGGSTFRGAVSDVQQDLRGSVEA